MRQIAQQPPAWEEAKVESESDVTRDAKKMQTGTLSNIDGFMSSPKFGIGEESIPKIQRTSCARSTTLSFFTEQSASASDMTAGKVLDTISRLPGFPGEASNAVSAYAPRWK